MLSYINNMNKKFLYYIILLSHSQPNKIRFNIYSKMKAILFIPIPMLSTRAICTIFIHFNYMICWSTIFKSQVFGRISQKKKLGLYVKY